MSETDQEHRAFLEAAVCVNAARFQEWPTEVTLDWFQTPGARQAWAWMAEARAAGQTPDLAALMANRQVNAVTAQAWEAQDWFPLPGDAIRALRPAVEADWLMRQYQQSLEALHRGEGPREVMEQLAGALEAHLTDAESTEWVGPVEALGELIEDMDGRLQPQRSHVMRYGWPTWDRLTQGLEPGQQVLIAARTGVGKTNVALNLTRHWVTAGVPVLYLSLEMPARKLAARWLAMESGVNSLTIARGRLTDDELRAMSAPMGRMGDWPLWVRDTRRGLLGLEEIGSLVRRAVRQHGVRAVVIDYAGLIDLHPLYRGENLTAMTSRMAARMKHWALSAEVAMVTLVQLSREIERRNPPIPKLSDLRDSGQWEANADVVWLLAEHETEDQITVVLAKNRDGPANVQFTLAWDAPTARLWDPEEGLA